MEAAGAGDSVVVSFDGEFPSKIKSFMLRENPRYVVDFYGVSKVQIPMNQSFEGTHVNRIRLGRHADKVRMVVEVNTADVSISRSESGGSFTLEIQ